MKKSIEYSKKIFPVLTITVTTNGLLLDSEKFRFLKEKGVRLSLSIDGPPSIHDLHRKMKETKTGSFNKILKNIREIPVEEKKKIAVNMVITPARCSALMERFLFIRKLGFLNIRFYPVFQSWWWGKDNIKCFEQAMLDFSKEYCKLFIYKRCEDIFIIGNMRDILKSRLVLRNKVYCVEDKLEDCNSIWLDTNGNFYICERVLGLNLSRKARYKVGDVENGIDFSLRAGLLSMAGKSFRKVLAKTNIKDKDCWFCPFSFYFRDNIEGRFGRGESFLFYFQILEIYRKAFYNIFATLKTNILFRKMYGLDGS